MRDKFRDLARQRSGLASLPVLARRRPVTITVVAIALMIATSAAVMTRTTALASGKPAYLDSHLPVPARVADLPGRMTLPEKIGQMVQIEATQVTDTSNSCTSTGGFNMPNPVCEQKIFVTNNVGSILAGGTDVPLDTTGNGGTGNTGLDWATEYNIMQSYAMAHSRLHIPVIFGVDAVHGFGHPWQAPLFPQSIGMGATWDPSAAQTGGQVTANGLRATRWVWDFAPVQDLSREDRRVRDDGVELSGCGEVVAEGRVGDVHGDLAGRDALGRSAGVHMVTLRFDAAQARTAVQQDVSSHSTPISMINQALERALTLKFR